MWDGRCSRFSTPMSVQPSTDGDTEQHTRECDHPDCEETREKWNLHHGYCSKGCRHRAKGEEVLEQIKHDQRFCSTCYRGIRSIDKPSSEWLDDNGSHVSVAINNGAKLVSADSDLQSQMDGGVRLNSVLDYTGVTGGMRKVNTESVIGQQYETEYTVRTPYGWSCVCGNTDHRHREPAIIDVEIEQVITFLYFALQQLFEEGQLNQSPTRSELFAGLREHWKDWEYAIGRCLHQ